MLVDGWVGSEAGLAGIAVSSDCGEQAVTIDEALDSTGSVDQRRPENLNQSSLIGAEFQWVDTFDHTGRGEFGRGIPCLVSIVGCSVD